MKKQNKIWEQGLSILLIFQVLVALALEVFIFVDFPGLVGQFGMQYQPDMGILQLLMGYNLLLSLSVSLWSVVWIRKGNLAGIQMGATLGLLLFLISMAVFIRFDRVDILLFDGVRAGLMLFFGILAYRERMLQPA